MSGLTRRPGGSGPSRGRPPGPMTLAMSQIEHSFMLRTDVRGLGSVKWVECSCGFATQPTRSRSKALDTLSAHLAEIPGEFKVIQRGTGREI